MPATTKRKKRCGVMLAKLATPALLKSLGPTCFAQRKLRGQRCRVVWVEDRPILLSSLGIPFSFMDHIVEALLLLPRLNYDGELYNHSMSQEQINSICNRTVNPHPDSEKIEFHVFDIASSKPQYFRFMTLDTTIQLHQSNRPVKAIPYEQIQTSDWLTFASRYVREGYEGIILRDMEALYYPIDPSTDSRKLSTLIKWKPTEKHPYTIVGLKEGTGWAEGMLGAFEVEDRDGVRFFVGTGPELTKEKRQSYWAEGEALLGSRLWVKHEPTKTTAAEVPICTSAWRVER